MALTTQTMDCVVIDRISYERMKLESEQFQSRTQELERENEMLKNELNLMKKLNITLENIKLNLDKLVDAVRQQFRLAETPFDREISFWQSEYTNIKCMLTQMGLLDTSDHLTNMCTTITTNGTETTAELVLTADQIWTANSVANSMVNGDQTLDNDHYLCADEDPDLDNSIVKSDANTTAADDCKPTKARQQSKKVKVTPTIDGEKRFKCTWKDCAYATDNRGNFQKHYRIHTGEKPYKCQYEGCTYSCSDPARFREHKLIHSTEKAYVCEWPGCTWKFKTYKLLKNHVKACHTGEKPHKCEWPGCEKQFLNKYEVRDHMRQHTGDRPFKCEYPECNGAFARSNTLTQHIREVHYYKKQFFCDYSDCDSRYDRVEELKGHIRDKHSKHTTELLINKQTVIDFNKTND